jgi:hypothetical protein
MTKQQIACDENACLTHATTIEMYKVRTKFDNRRRKKGAPIRRRIHREVCHWEK